MKDRAMKNFDIDCGEHVGRGIKARTLGAAWRKLTKNRKTGFGQLARFSENGSVWKYVTPQALDKTP